MFPIARAKEGSRQAEEQEGRRCKLGHADEQVGIPGLEVPTMNMRMW